MCEGLGACTAEAFFLPSFRRSGDGDPRRLRPMLPTSLSIATQDGWACVGFCDLRCMGILDFLALVAISQVAREMERQAWMARASISELLGLMPVFCLHSSWACWKSLATSFSTLTVV